MRLQNSLSPWQSTHDLNDILYLLELVSLSLTESRRSRLNYPNYTECGFGGLELGLVSSNDQNEISF